MRRAGAALLAAALAGSAGADILGARYSDPTTRYAHGILGDAVEWGTLEIDTDTGPRRFVLPPSRVFEDIAPRLADLDADGRPEVIVIETDAGTGAALAIYGEDGKIAQTPHIGRTHRWLAPLGAVDLDGDGAVEIAYIDRPHLARILRIWRYGDGRLSHVADHPGLTNHRIGEDFISGGIRDCGQGPEIVTASADWSRLVAATLNAGVIETRDIGPQTGPESFAAALACR